VNDQFGQIACSIVSSEGRAEVFKLEVCCQAGYRERPARNHRHFAVQRVILES
jgi:hypothetical protein